MPNLDSPAVANEPLTHEHNLISRRLVTARANAAALPDFPGQLPATLEQAYAIQTRSISRWPDDIAGWKVGMVPEDFRVPLAAERLSGPIFRSSVFAVTPDSAKTMAIYTGGFAAVEAEFIFELAQSVPPVEKQYSDADLVDLIASLHVGAEIASSPMADINVLGPCCVVSDFGNNAGLLVGPAVPHWSELKADELTAKVIVDDAVVGTATAGAIEGGLLQALRFLIQTCASRGMTLSRGSFISCGAVTGIHDVTVDSKATVDFGQFGAFHVAFEPMQPQPLNSASAVS